MEYLTEKEYILVKLNYNNDEIFVFYYKYFK